LHSGVTDVTFLAVFRLSKWVLVYTVYTGLQFKQLVNNHIG